MADNSYQMAMELVDEVSPALDNIKDKLMDVMNNAGGMGKMLSGAAVGIGIAVGVMEVFSRAAEGAVMQVASLADQANRLGMTVEDLQVFVNTMGAFGVQADRSVDALTDMKERIGEARQGSGEMLAALKELNIPLKAANGEWRMSSEVTDELTEKLVNMADASRRVRLSAQAGGDAYRDMIGNIAQQPELLAKARDRARENLLITNELAEALRVARVEIALYNQKQADAGTLGAAAMIPLMNWWKQVKSDIGLSTQGLLQFFGVIDKATGASRMAELHKEISEIDDDIRRINEGDDSVLLFLKWSGNVERAMYNRNKLQKEYNELAAQMPKPDGKSQTETVSQSASQIDGQKKALEAAEKARKEAQVRAITDFEKQAKAELNLLKESLNAEMEEQIKANYITGEAEAALRREYGERILAEEKMTADKIATFRKTEAEKNLREEKSTNDAREAQMKRFHSVLQGIVADQVIAEKTTEALRAQQDNPLVDVDRAKRAAQMLEEQTRLNDMLDEMNLTTEERTRLELELNKALAGRDVAQLVLAESERIGKFNELLAGYVEEARKSEAIVNNTEDQLELDLARVEAKKLLMRELTAEEDAALKQAITQKQQFDELARNAEDSAKEMERIYATAAENIQGAFSDFFFDVMQGNMTNLADSFKRTIDRMVAELLASQLFKMVGGIGNGTAAGGGLSGVFAGLFGGISGRATGGPINSGTPYWVGEEGPEIVVPRGNGTVIPADVSEAMVSGKGSSGESYHISINALDSKSFMDMIERDDRSIVKALANAQQKYRM